MNILIVYYSQTGQLLDIINHLFKEKQEDVNLFYLKIEPVQPFPFPWKAAEFFDCMPESVLQLAEPIKPLSFPKEEMDLVVLGYTPWFLSPSIPVNSFLKSEFAKYLTNKPVLTVVGSRNMWLNAQEKVKQALQELNAQLVGNIVFVDRSPNLISVLTIIRWTFTGVKEKTKWLPSAGVRQADIEAGSRFGPVITQALRQQTWQDLHPQLLQLNSVSLKPGLIVLEKRGITNFRKFAPYIKEKGGRGDLNRAGRVKLFQRLLIVGVFILSPISNLTAALVTIIKGRKLKEEVKYFMGISFKDKAL